jgi:hypothetical protein
MKAIVREAGGVPGGCGVLENGPDMGAERREKSGRMPSGKAERKAGRKNVQRSTPNVQRSTARKGERNLGYEEAQEPPSEMPTLV